MAPLDNDPAIGRTSLDDFMGDRWEEAFHEHLRHLATSGMLGEVVAVGRF